MHKKSKSVPTQEAPSREPQQEMCVLTTRITIDEREKIRQAAGWGGLQKFVRDAVLAAVERAQKPTK